MVLEDYEKERLTQRQKSRRFSARCLERLSKGVVERIKLNGNILEEVLASDKLRRHIDERALAYEREGIGSPRNSNGEDVFDRYSRFFVLKDSDENVLKVVRAVNRKNPYGIVPSELSLKSLPELFDFFGKKGCTKLEVLKQSTIDSKGKKGIEDMLSKYSNSNKVYEVSGLFGFSKSSSDMFALILGIGQIAYKDEEGWDLVIQTQREDHIGIYSMLYPYEIVAGHTQIIKSRNGAPVPGYLDYCGRNAITLALEGQKFRERYDELREVWEEVYGTSI